MPVLNLDMSNIPIYCSPGLSECLSFSFKTNDSTKNLKFYDKDFLKTNESKKKYCNIVRQLYREKNRFSVTVSVANLNRDRKPKNRFSSREQLLNGIFILLYHNVFDDSNTCDLKTTLNISYFNQTRVNEETENQEMNDMQMESYPDCVENEQNDEENKCEKYKDMDNEKTLTRRKKKLRMRVMVKAKVRRTKIMSERVMVKVKKKETKIMSVINLSNDRFTTKNVLNLGFNPITSENHNQNATASN
ncbi:hypothetical protein BpHYR1_048076 [Brachionus plicatilis]|uniref:Uncharacterized protein n=1 Tax=Brachionus plicatilis TaxID=10195 RepID=A0A3M7QXW6_BRAPC|nr:hypothetical protein BpHYR1_048076 [Brachionus plicatilis]